MASLEAELRILKNEYSSHLTREEALDLAMKAAELHMKFLRLATDKSEKTRLTNSCNALLDDAERIKVANTWDFSGTGLSEFEFLQPICNTASTPVDRFTSSLRDRQAATHATFEQSAKAQDLDALIAVDMSVPYPDLRPPILPVDEIGLQNPSPQSLCKAPRSTRVLPKSEQILLLRSSHVYGFTFPPWHQAPSASEFELSNGKEQFL